MWNDFTSHLFESDLRRTSQTTMLLKRYSQALCIMESLKRRTAPPIEFHIAQLELRLAGKALNNALVDWEQSC
jgi:hypothetical protein